MANDKKAIVKNFAMPSPILSGLINGIKGGPSRIRTYEGTRPADLQSAPVDRFGIDPFYKSIKTVRYCFIINKLFLSVKLKIN